MEENKMTTFSTATIHSIERAKERANLNEKKAIRNIAKALERGKKASDFSSWERSYLEDESTEVSTAIAYNGFCYIIGEYGQCITLYALPSWFGNKKHFVGKEKIRNYKKYCKNNRVYNEQYAYC